LAFCGEGPHPAQPIPLLTAANGRKSMRPAGQYGDGLTSDPLTWKQHKSEWQEAGTSAGKNPADVPALIEHYVVVGDQAAVRQAAEWRFGPKAFKGSTACPIRPDRAKGDAETPIDEVLKSWAVGTDPAVHTEAGRESFDGGASIVSIHSGQPDQKRVIELSGSHVLPDSDDSRCDAWPALHSSIATIWAIRRGRRLRRRFPGIRNTAAAAMDRH
jgi:hypothetical protein